MNLVFDRKKNSFSFFALIVVLISSISFGTIHSSAKTNSADSPAFVQFNVWLNSYLNNAAELRTEEQISAGEKLAAERAVEFKRLAETSPETAVQKAIAPEVFRQLPERVANLLEKPVSFEGDFWVYTIDEKTASAGQFGASQIVREVIFEGKRLRALVYGRRTQMTTKFNIPLSGYVIGDSILLNENPARKIDAREFSRLVAARSIENSAASGDEQSSLAEGETAAEIGGKAVAFSSEQALADFVKQQIEWESSVGPTRQNQETSAAQMAPDATASTWTTGAKTVLVIRVDFPDRAGEPLDHYNQPLTLTRAQSLFNTSINSFYQANSYQKTSLSATVTPLIRLPQAQSYYAQGTNYNQMLDDARAAARAAGYETNNYSLDVVCFSYTPSIAWAGLAAIGAKSAWLNGAFYLTEASHELGHNYGLMHANLWRTTDGTANGAGSNVEYGDCFDTMGACANGDANRHFNARYKFRLDWLTSADVQTATANGTYRIYAQDTAASGARLLKIPKDATKNYWVEFRQLTPGTAQNGALIRWDSGTATYPETQLLDMTPSTLSVADAPLTVGQSFYDSVSQIRVTIVGKNEGSPASLDVQVQIGQTNATARSVRFDFDGDGKADPSVFRPTNATWYSSQSRDGFQALNFGLPTDKPVAADYDGDGKTDAAVYRNGTWYLQRSTLGFTGVQFGLATDIPAPSDFDGDGRAELAVFRPSNGTWYFYNLTSNSFTSSPFGANGDKPVAADYDGDGRADVAVYRPSDGTWYLQRSTLGFTASRFGIASDVPVPADYDGDGKADVAVFRTGNWYFLYSSTGQIGGLNWGVALDKPVPADFDGDGKTDAAVYRSGTWYISQSAAGYKAVNFGLEVDTPIPTPQF